MGCEASCELSRGLDANGAVGSEDKSGALGALGSTPSYARGRGQ